MKLSRTSKYGLLLGLILLGTLLIFHKKKDVPYDEYDGFPIGI